MAELVVNTAEAVEQPQAEISQLKDIESETACSAENEQNLKKSVTINETKNPSVADDAVAKLQSRIDEPNDRSSKIGDENSIEETRSSNFMAEPAKNTTKKKITNIFDSDSEEEDDYISSLLNKSRVEERDVTAKNAMTDVDAAKSGKKSRRTIDSESEGEDSGNAEKKTKNGNEESRNEDESSDESAKKKIMKSRFRTLIDSESDDDNELKPIQNSQEEDDERPSSDVSETAKDNKKRNVRSIVDSSDDDDDREKSVRRSSAVKSKKIASTRNRKTKTDKKIVKSKISSLIDTDSEDDNKREDVNQTPQNARYENENFDKKTEKSAKKRTGSIRSAKDEAMRQIHSETQRLIRSSEISLPYHRPKQRSLQEFLNRKQFIPALPAGLTTAEKVKMSSQIVGKVLEEKEKEAELFYKSSDSEDEETITTTLANPEEENKESSSVPSVDHSNIEETQKILKNDVQNAHNKKEIIQQGAVDIGLPRKLFANDEEYSTENRIAEPDGNDEEILDTEDPVKKTKEIKHGLKEVSVPRKLFGSDYEDTSNPTNIHECPAAIPQSVEIAESITEIVDPSTNENTADSIVETGEASSKKKVPEARRDDDTTDDDASALNANTKEIGEFTNISDTPFISNKEFAKLNVKSKISGQTVELGEKLENDEDSKDAEMPIGHVYGLPPPVFDRDDVLAAKSSDAKKKVLSRVTSVGPKLRGSPGQFIDLSDDVKPNKQGVQSLVDRFIRHSVVNASVESTSPVTVIHAEKTADGVKIVEQTLPYKIPTMDNFDDKELSKPGAKYRRLKNELIEKMAKKRGEDWKLKKQQERENSEDSEEIEDDFDEATEEEGLDEKLRISGESEPEEDDMPAGRKKKRRPRNFADEEAEVSGEEDEEEMEIGDEDEEEDDNEDGEENVDVDDETRDDPSDAEDETAEEPKKPSRILKAFEDDSNSLPEASQSTDIASREKAFERTNTDVDMFSPENGNDGWFSDTESELPPSQILPRDQADARSQSCKTPLTAVNILRFVSPITQLTAFNSGVDSPNDFPGSKITPRPNPTTVLSSVEKTPFEKQSPITINSEKRNGFQKKLFDDPAGTINDEELMGLCSGKFTGIGNDDETMESHNIHSKTGFSTSSSDPFASDVRNSKKNDDKVTREDVDVADGASQDIKLTLDGDSEDSCGKIIGEETETKSKAPWAMFNVASSSDDDDSRKNSVGTNEGGRKRVKKKRVKKLELSDDEDEREASSSEEGDVFDGVDNENEDKFVDYDSEENEVVVVPRKDIKKVAARFLDEEAELSESEWGSADEDEKDLDKLEIEEADAEEYDENQMRDQLGKIRMRQVLDDDQREVRMLQELLFDDGDLHNEGSGRERQFKWKNIDSLGDDDKLGPRNDEAEENGDAVEEDNDLEWRKQRLEREKFIEDKMKSSTDIANDGLESDSQIFKLGIKALKKSKSMQISQKEPEAASTKKPSVPRTVLDLLGCSDSDKNSRIIMKSVKRGSFLARGDECLARLAVQIKHTETTITTRKNPRNCVFTHMSPSVAGTSEEEKNVESTKNDDSPANTKTKKRKPPAGVTPRTAKKAKIEVTRTTGKKLF